MGGDRVIKAAVMKLATMFNPVGAIIQAIITIYNTVMFLIERINQILDFVEAVVNSVYKESPPATSAPPPTGSNRRWPGPSRSSSASGAAPRPERLSDKIKGFIKKIHGWVDKAIDKVIDKVLGWLKNLVAKVTGKGKKDSKEADTEDVKVEQTFSMAGQSHTLYAEITKGKPKLAMASDRINELSNALGTAILNEEKKGEERTRLCSAA